MGLFSRRTEAPVSRTTHGHHSHGKHTHRDSGALDHHTNRRPPFGQWLRTAWLDVLTMAALGAVGLGVCSSMPLGFLFSGC